MVFTLNIHISYFLPSLKQVNFTNVGKVAG